MEGVSSNNFIYVRIISKNCYNLYINIC